jgi:transcriptional regulator with XRE-family HTH domain
MTNTQQRVATEIQFELIRLGMTKRQLAARLGWDQTKLSRKLHGGSELTLAEMDAIADVLGVSVASLVGCAARDSNSQPADYEYEMAAAS